MKIAIIGAGEIGQAIGGTLQGIGREVVFWDKNESRVKDIGEQTYALPEVLRQAEIVFFGVSSWALHEALAFSSPYLKKGMIAVSPAKGVNEQTGLLAIDIFKKMLPNGVSAVVMGGALIAEEISAGLGGAAALASSNFSAAQKTAELFRGTKIKASVLKDAKGLAAAGVAKNIVALALGIAEGLEWGMNEKGLLFAGGVDEAKRLVVLLGGNRETVYAPPVFADFVATAFSKNSANRQSGLDLAKHGSAGESESVRSLPALVKIIGDDKIKKLPLVWALSRIVNGEIDTGAAFKEWREAAF